MIAARSLTLALLLAGSAGIAACGGRASTPVDGPPDATYTVRAEISQMPSALRDEIYLHHESIPGFRNSNGDVVGMMSMSMPFTVGPEIEIAKLKVGDRVEATFEVRWSAAAKPLRVVSMVPLPEGTRLEFDADDEAGEEPLPEDVGYATDDPPSDQP